MQILDLSVLVTFIETTLPTGVWFNTHGVAMRGYRWTVWDNGGKLEFDVICRNGLWGGSCEVCSSSWGYGGPITRSDCKYPTLSECITDMWEYFAKRVSSNDKESERSSINYRTKWFKKAEAEYKHFMALKPEYQLQLFKEVDFYGKI